MFDRKTLLAKLDIGDIFHAESPGGASLICLVLSVDQTTIKARRVTTQENLEFDRRTGVTVADNEGVPCVIDSVAPLPAKIHDVFLELDRKYQKYRPDRDPERFKLTDAEKKALLFVGPHYASNPLASSVP
jgi:hypothetical protein